MSSIIQAGPVMVKFFTKSAPKHPLVSQKGSFVQDQRGCMAIIKGNLMPLREIRSFIDKGDKKTPAKDEDVAKAPKFTHDEDENESFFSKKGKEEVKKKHDKDKHKKSE